MSSLEKLFLASMPTSQFAERFKPSTLDVGCGITPRGDVNCDVTSEMQGLSKKGRRLVWKRNFVKCDGQHLPFKDNVFQKVVCFHVIEHVKNPFLLLKELLRVCNGRVFIRCPHRFSSSAKNPFHIHYFTRTWFALQLLNYPHSINTTVDHTPFEFSPLILPSEIRVIIDKKVEERLIK